jgi:hypothetical protein
MRAKVKGWGEEQNLSTYQAVEAHTAVRFYASHIVYAIGSQMAVRLSALCTGRTLLP